MKGAASQSATSGSFKGSSRGKRKPDSRMLPTLSSTRRRTSLILQHSCKSACSVLSDRGRLDSLLKLSSILQSCKTHGDVSALNVAIWTKPLSVQHGHSMTLAQRVSVSFCSHSSLISSVFGCFTCVSLRARCVCSSCSTPFSPPHTLGADSSGPNHMYSNKDK